MKTVCTAAAALLFGALPAIAQTTGTPQKLSMAECQMAWNQANPEGKPSVSNAGVEKWVTDVKKVDLNNDGMVSAKEFTNACGQGFVRSAEARGSQGAAGAGAGTAGQSADPESGRNPGEMRPGR